MWRTVIIFGLYFGAGFSSPLGEKNMPMLSDEMLNAKSEMAMSTLNLPSNATSIRADITDGFSCDGKMYGYYADIDNDCQIFHVCLPVVYPDGKENTFRWSFICPEETLFSQESFTCVRSLDLNFDCSDSVRFYDLNRNFGVAPESDSDSHDMLRKTPMDNSKKTEELNKIEEFKKTEESRKPEQAVKKTTLPASTSTTTPLPTRRRTGESNLRVTSTKAPTKPQRVKPTRMPITTTTGEPEIKPMLNRKEFLKKNATTGLRKTPIRPIPSRKPAKPVDDDEITHIKIIPSSEAIEAMKTKVKVSHPRPAQEPTRNKEVTKTPVKQEVPEEAISQVHIEPKPQEHIPIREGVAIHADEMPEENLKKEQISTVASEKTEPLEFPDMSMNENKHVEEVTTLPVKHVAEAEPSQRPHEVRIEGNEQESLIKPMVTSENPKEAEQSLTDATESSTNKSPESTGPIHISLNEPIEKPENPDSINSADSNIEDAQKQVPMEENIMPVEESEIIKTEVQEKITEKVPSDESEIIKIGSDAKPQQEAETPMLPLKISEMPSKPLQETSEQLIKNAFPALPDEKPIHEFVDESQTPAAKPEEEKFDIIKTISNLVTQATKEAGLPENSSTLKLDDLAVPTSEMKVQEASQIANGDDGFNKVPTRFGAAARPQVPLYIPVQVIMDQPGMATQMNNLENHVENLQHKDNPENENIESVKTESITVENPIEKEAIITQQTAPEKQTTQTTIEAGPIEMNEPLYSRPMHLQAEILPMPEDEVKILEDQPNIEMMASPFQPNQPNSQPEDGFEAEITQIPNEANPATVVNLVDTAPIIAQEILDIAANLIKAEAMSATADDDFPMIHDLSAESAKDEIAANSAASNSNNDQPTTISNSAQKPLRSKPIEEMDKKENIFDSVLRAVTAEKIGELVERTDLMEPEAKVANRAELARSLASKIDPRKRRFLFRSNLR